MGNGSSKKTYLRVENLSNTDFKTKVSEIDNYDWDGGSRPDHNFDNYLIKAGGGSKQEREEINANANGKWVKLTFVFANGYESSIRFCQHYALRGCPHKSRFVIKHGKFEIGYDYEGDETMVITVKDDQQLQQLIKNKKKDAQNDENNGDKGLDQVSHDIDADLNESVEANFGKNSESFNRDIEKLNSVISKFQSAKKKLSDANNSFKEVNQTAYQNKQKNLNDKEQKATNLKNAVTNIKNAYQCFDQNPEQTVTYFKEAIQSLTKAGKSQYETKINNLNQQIEEINIMHKEIIHIAKVLNHQETKHDRHHTEILKSINDYYNKTKEMLEREAVSLKNQLQGVETNIKMAVKDGNQDLKQKLEKEAGELKSQLQNTEKTILDNTNDAYKEQIDIIIEQHQNVMHGIESTKQALIATKKELSTQLTNVEQNLKDNSTELSEKVKKDLKICIRSNCK